MDVGDILWQSQPLPDDHPRPDISNVDGVSAVDHLPGVLDESISLYRDVLVGLQVFQYPDDPGPRIELTFIAADRDTSFVEFFGRHADGLNAQYASISKVLPVKTDGRGGFFDRLTAINDLMLNQDEPGVREKINELYGAEIAATEIEPPEPDWNDLSPDSRALTPGNIPDELAASLEVIGVEFELSGERPPADAGILIQSTQGVALTMSAGIQGSPIVAAYRTPDEELLVVYEVDGGVRTEIGRISGVPSAHVALVSIKFDGDSVPTYEQNGHREATDSEVRQAMAAGYEQR